MVVGIIVTCVLAIGFMSIWELRFDTVGQRQKQDAQIFSGFISQQIDNEINIIRAYVISPWWHDAIKEANLRYVNWEPKAIQEYMARMDKEWLVPGSQFVQETLSSRMSQRLTALAKEDLVVAEIFLTDRYGGLVAASGKTSDYYQADEDWWQRSYANGKGSVYVGEVEFDESSGKISTAIAIPVKDKTGQVIGVAKVVLDIFVFFEPLMRYKFGATGHVALLDKQGEVIYHPGMKPMSKSGFSESELSRILNDKNGFAMIEAPCLKAPSVVAADKIKNVYLEANGINWMVLVTQGKKEIFWPLYKIFFLKIILVLFLSALIIFVLHRIVKTVLVDPLQKIKQGMQRFSEGYADSRIDLKTGDEMQILAETFNEMTGKLYKTTVSKEYLDNILVSMSDGLIVVDPDSKIIMANKATCAFFECTDQELIGKDVSSLFPGAEDEKGSQLTADKFDALIREGKLNDYEINYKSKEGKEISILLSGAVMQSSEEQPEGFLFLGGEEKNKNPKTLGAVYVIKDITERKKLQEESRRRLQELEVFYKVGFGREERIIELKKEIEQLKKELDK